MGQSITVEPTLVGDVVIYDADRSLTGQDGAGFGSAEDRAAFAADLQAAVAELVARYHHDDGRPHRLTVSSYPRPLEQP